MLSERIQTNRSKDDLTENQNQTKEMNKRATERAESAERKEEYSFGDVPRARRCCMKGKKDEEKNCCMTFQVLILKQNQRHP